LTLCPAFLAPLQRSNDRSIDWKTRYGNYLKLALTFKALEFGVVHPVNAVHWTGVDRFLEYFFGVSILANHARSSVVRLDIEGVAGNVSAMLTADAGNFIDVNSTLAHAAAQLWFKPSPLLCFSPSST
jgi:hypothetical protein